MSGIANWQAQIRIDIEDLKKRIKVAEGEINNFTNEDRKLKLDIDTKTLESAIQKLDKMLDSLGKGTGDFKQFENLSKELSNIVSEVQSLSKAFGKVDDSGTKTLLSSIQNIDKSLSELNQNILNVNKNMSNMGGNTSGAVKQVENITNESKKAASALEDVAKVQEKVNGQKTNISSGSNLAIEQQNKLQEELKETQQQAENTAKAILKVTGYRGTNGGDPVTSNKSGATFWDSKKNVANMYGTNSSDKTLWSSELSFNNPFTFDAKKQKYGDITYLGDGADYASREIIELTQRENELRKALDNSTKSGLEEVKMAYELQDVCQRIAKISKDSSNPYGTHSTDWFAEYAKNNGYDGVAIKNVLDTPDSYVKNGTEVSDVYITFQREQLQNTTLLAKANHELAESEREVALAELGVTKNKATSSNNSLEDKIKSIFTDAKELKQILESLHNGKYFSFDTSENDDALGRVRELQKILEDYGYKIKNFKDDSEAFCVSGVITSLEEENNALDKNTKKIKENQQMRSQNQRNDAFPDKDVSASVEAATNSIKEENNVLEQNTQKVKENTQAKEQNTNVNFNKYDKRLDSYNGKIDKYKTTINRFNDGGWTSSTYLENVQAVKNAVKEYEDLLKELKGKDASLVTSEDINKLDDYEKKIKDTIATVTNMSASEKGYNFVSAQKELDKIHKLLNENSNMSAEAKAKIKSYYAEIESGNPSMSLDRIHGEIMKIYNAEVEAGRAGKSFFDTLKNSGFHQLAAQMAGMFGFYDVINGLKQVAYTVIDINTQITELAKVSEQTSKQIYSDFDSYADIAKEVRGAISDTIAATADWSKNGYSIPDSKQLAEISQLYKNVGDGINIDEANESLISTLKGFKLEADQAEHIVDVFNEVSNNEAISSAGIGDALQRSAASFNAANTSLEQSVALVTATNSVLQDPEKVGNMWKTVSARIRGAKTELTDMGEDTDGLVESTSKLQALVKGITGVDILESDGKTFKDIYTIVSGISEKWATLSDIDRASLLESLAGKNQSNAFAAALSQPEILKKAYEEATNAEGSARRENEEYAKSVQASINLTKAKLEELSNDLLSSDFLKGAIDAGGKLIEVLDGIVKSGSAIPIVITAIVAILGKGKSTQRFCPVW